MFLYWSNHIEFWWLMRKIINFHLVLVMSLCVVMFFKLLSYKLMYFLSITEAYNRYVVLSINEISIFQHSVVVLGLINSLASGRCNYNHKLVIVKLLVRIDILNVSCEIPPRWTPQHVTDGLVPSATSHYQSQCWPTSIYIVMWRHYVTMS